MGLQLTLQLMALFAATWLLPAYFLVAFWQKSRDEPLRWLLAGLYTAFFIAYAAIAGRWDWSSVYGRYLWPALFLIVTLASFRHVRSKPFRFVGGRATWTDIATCLAFAIFLAASMRGYFYAEEPVYLDFPLEDGWYYVGQGGNSPLINYHNTYRPQQYALDIVALDAWGRRATGLYPSELSRYVIFGKTVVSPCDGTVTAAVDDLPDLRPPETDEENLAGNMIVIECRGVNIVLAHLQRGSVTVRVGDRVSSGQRIGKVGNSGNTTEPHLHIHAVRADIPSAIEGQGVPIVFEETFPVRNSMFIR